MARSSKQNGNTSPPLSGNSRLEKLREKQAQITDLIRAEEAALRKGQRRLEEHKKYSVGGHFLPLIEQYTNADTNAEITLSDEELAKLMLAHMRRFMNTPHHRKVLGLPPIPASDQPANDGGSLKPAFTQKQKA